MEQIPCNVASSSVSQDLKVHYCANKTTTLDNHMLW